MEEASAIARGVTGCSSGLQASGPMEVFWKRWHELVLCNNSEDRTCQDLSRSRSPGQGRSLELRSLWFSACSFGDSAQHITVNLQLSVSA